MKELPPPSVRSLRWALAIPLLAAPLAALVLLLSLIPQSGREALDEGHPILVLPGVLAGSALALPTYLPLFLFGWFAVRRWPWARIRVMFLLYPPLHVLLTVCVVVLWTAEWHTGAYALMSVCMLAVAYAEVAVALAAIGIARRRTVHRHVP